MRLLLVEDDARLGQAVRDWMAHEGIDVHWITHGREVEPALHARAYDGMVLDLGLPDMDGEQALRGLRAAGFELHVIVMTAREQVQDRVRLLDLGADDFLVKPVHLNELAARLRAVVRRRGAGEGGEPALRHGPLCLVPASRTVSVDGSYVSLTNREFMLLQTLLRHEGRVVTRAQLLEGLCDLADESVGNAVEVHVHHLRRKLGRGLIKTVRGVGYSVSAKA